MICCALLFYILVMLYFIYTLLSNVILYNRNVMLFILILYRIIVPLIIEITLMFFQIAVTVWLPSNSVVCSYIDITIFIYGSPLNVIVVHLGFLFHRYHTRYFFINVIHTRCIEAQIIVPLNIKSVVCNIWYGLLHIYIWFKLLFYISFLLVCCSISIFYLIHL